MRKIWLVIMLVLVLGALESKLTYKIYQLKHPNLYKLQNSNNVNDKGQSNRQDVVQKTEPNNVRGDPKPPKVKVVPSIPKVVPSPPKVEEKKFSTQKDFSAKMKSGVYQPSSNCDLLRYFADSLEMNNGENFADVIAELDTNIASASSDLKQFDFEFQRAAVFTILHKEVKKALNIIIDTVKEMEADPRSTTADIIEYRSQIETFETAISLIDVEMVLLLNEGGRKFTIIKNKYPNIDFDKRYSN